MEHPMARLLSVALLALLASSALSAQNLGSAASPSGDSSPDVVEMKIQRALSPDSNGVADLLPGVDADKLILHYTLLNTGARDLELTGIAISEQVNCRVVVTGRPDSTVAADGATTMNLEVTLQEQGPFSFTVSMAVDGREYSFPVQATVEAVLHWSISAHSHDHDDDHHCSTGAGGSWLLMGGVAAILGTLIFRRRAA
jgi:hypothetical protein